MERFATLIYMSELEHQAEFAVIAVEHFNLANEGETRSVPRAFAAAQALLGAAAMISKLLWPTPSALGPDGAPLEGDEAEVREWAIERGRYLRRELHIKSIPVLQSRKVRNAFEHFDDRLDRFMRDGNRIVVDRHIAAPGAIKFPGGEPPKSLRAIDPTTWTISVLDDEVSLQELADAVADVGARAHTWLER